VSGSQFTEEVRAGLLARLELGVPFADAALAAGVRPETARSWLTRGRREGDGPYGEFAQAVDEAREVAGSRPVPMDEVKLAEVVSGLARTGSVQAAKLRWQMLRAERTGPLEGDVMDHLDELGRLSGLRGRPDAGSMGTR
jgi:hypothetical protein